ncbi:MAG: membrane protein insertase YidC [Myxococcota bacterium]
MMERNFLLALALSFGVLALWTMYTAPTPEELQAAEAERAIAAAEVESRAVREGVPGADPMIEPEAPTGSAAVSPPPIPVEPAEPVKPEETVDLRTDLVHAVFTSRGGGLIHWELEQYRDAYEPGEPPVELTAFPSDRLVGLSTPLGSLGYGDLSQKRFEVSRPDSRSVVFTRTQAGITVRKIYRIEDGSYELNLRIEIENGSDRHLSPTFRVGWPVGGRDTPDWSELAVSVLHEGGVESHLLGSGGAPMSGFFGGGLEETETYAGDVEWAGASTRYFLAAMIPESARDARARVVPPAGDLPASVELELKEVNVPPGQSAARDFRMYLGPKEVETLDLAGAHLDEAIPKGWFPPLTNFFTWALTAVHNVIPNYGIAIIVITIIVRLLMYPVMQKQMKSMKRMTAMQPRMKELQEKYADDKPKQSEEMMKLYKESGFNPLTGCLPMFLQLPVFIGLYYALQGAIQLRQEPFFGWITDLSAPETLFMVPGLELPIRVLPLLMGLSMVVQTRMTPTTMDPAQARMMNTVMPVMFTVLFYGFASGLVLYWLVSNVLGIGQQVLINRRKDDGIPLTTAAKPAEANPPAQPSRGKKKRK